MPKKQSVTKLKRPPTHENSKDENEASLSKVSKLKNEIPIKMTKKRRKTAKRETAKQRATKSEIKPKVERKIKIKVEKPLKEPTRGRKRSAVTVTKASTSNTNDYIPKEKGDRILTCGTGDFGPLGLGETTTSCNQPILIENFEPQTNEFLQIAAGGMHTVVLTADNNVYTCGCNDEGALGRDCFDDNGNKPEDEDDDKDFTLRRVKFDDHSLEEHGRIVMISAGDSHTAALTNKGSVFIWGTFRDPRSKEGCLGISLNDSRHDVVTKRTRPVLLSSYKERIIVKISSGNNHLAMLSNNRLIFTVGAGNVGQLGRLGPHKRDSTDSHRSRSTMLMPKEVGVKAGRGKVFFTDLWCTGYCCFAKSSAYNKIFVWGLNNYYQLGYDPNDPNQLDVHNNPVPVHNPVPSEQFTSDRPWKQFGGEHHIVAATDDGAVYVIGRGADSRLGVGNDVEQQKVLTRLEVLNNIDGVSAGINSSFAWTKEGVGYAWGRNINGGELGLGLGDNGEAAVPNILTGNALENCKIMNISAGGQHTVIMAKANALG